MRYSIPIVVFAFLAAIIPNGYSLPEDFEKSFPTLHTGEILSTIQLYYRISENNRKCVQVNSGDLKVSLERKQKLSECSNLKITSGGKITAADDMKSCLTYTTVGNSPLIFQDCSDNNVNQVWSWGLNQMMNPVTKSIYEGFSTTVMNSVNLFARTTFAYTFNICQVNSDICLKFNNNVVTPTLQWDSTPKKPILFTYDQAQRIKFQGGFMKILLDYCLSATQDETGTTRLIIQRCPYTHESEGTTYALNTRWYFSKYENGGYKLNNMQFEGDFKIVNGDKLDDNSAVDANIAVDDNGKLLDLKNFQEKVKK